MRAAIDSALHQTYTNKEIILVDDGSTDHSGEICDWYADRFKSIQVIHQKNGGLSAARNTGITNSKGEYIALLDSDDEFGVPDMIERYMKILSQNNSIEILQFPVWFADEGSRRTTNNINKHLTNKDAIAESFRNEEIAISAWNKIYKRSIFTLYKFAEGRLFEDLWFLIDIFDDLNNILLCDYGYYVYHTRGGSIMHSFFSKSKCYQMLETHFRLVSYIADKWPHSLAHLKRYHDFISAYFEFSKEYGLNAFSEIINHKVTYKPTLRSIFSYGNAIDRNTKLKLLLVNLIGLNTSFYLFSLKRYVKQML